MTGDDMAATPANETPSYDPISGQLPYPEMIATADDLIGRIPTEVATANHVFDTLRAASLEALEEHIDTVELLVAALPAVLSYRLIRLHHGKLRYDDSDRDPRQPFWRTIRERREFAALTAGIT